MLVGSYALAVYQTSFDDQTSEGVGNEDDGPFGSFLELLAVSVHAGAPPVGLPR
jgi:hypothetical protein